MRNGKSSKVYAFMNTNEDIGNCYQITSSSKMDDPFGENETIFFNYDDISSYSESEWLEAIKKLGYLIKKIKLPKNQNMVDGFVVVDDDVFVSDGPTVKFNQDN